MQTCDSLDAHSAPPPAPPPSYSCCRGNIQRDFKADCMSSVTVATVGFDPGIVCSVQLILSN